MSRGLMLFALWMLAGAPVFANVPMDKKVTVQPILIQGSMAAPDWFEAETDKIWAQAGIDVKFLPLQTIVSPASIVIDSELELENFFATASGRSEDPTVINVWFTREISFGGVMGTITGYTHHVGSNLIVITEYSVQYLVIDTLSHELGHALGLSHLNDPPDPYNPMSDYLMSSMLFGTHSIDDIYPDGLCNAKLTESQVSQARSSPYVKLINPYTLRRSVIGNGGGTSSGGIYTVTGTVGQPDAGYHKQNSYELLGGFWVGGPLCIVNLEQFARFAAHWLDGPCNESNNWCGGADLNQFNDVDVVDLTILAGRWLNVCPFGWPLK